jgi:hypothetical protein
MNVVAVRYEPVDINSCGVDRVRLSAESSEIASERGESEAGSNAHESTSGCVAARRPGVRIVIRSRRSSAGTSVENVSSGISFQIRQMRRGEPITPSIGCPRDGSLEQFGIMLDRTAPRQRLESIVDRCVLTVLNTSDFDGTRCGHTEWPLESSVLFEELI